MVLAAAGVTVTAEVAASAGVTVAKTFSAAVILRRVPSSKVEAA